MERNVKFSQPDTRHTGKNQPDNRPEGSGAKNRSKSSTLSLHAGAVAKEREEEPPLQRRNSIHNVPFVDVHDPDTRTRMERYKEERRSMLRAKYKAEDYLSSSFSRKKKVSTTSQDSEADVASSPVSSPPSPDQEDPSPLEKTEDPTETQLTKFAQETTANVSQKFLKLKQPEQQSFISKAFVPEPKNGIFYKTEVAVASVQKKSSNALNFNKPQPPRPDELTISDPVERENNSKNLTRSDSSDTSPESESVNVRERASIFGPRKFSETKVRTVSAPLSSARPVPVPRASKQLQSQTMTSPSKIRNMAAMFEQSQ